MQYMCCSDRTRHSEAVAEAATRALVQPAVFHAATREIVWHPLPASPHTHCIALAGWACPDPECDALIAFHEAGHTVTGIRLGYTVEYVSITPDRSGDPELGMSAGRTSLNLAPGRPRNLFARSEMLVLASGWVAEMLHSAEDTAFNSFWSDEGGGLDAALFNNWAHRLWPDRTPLDKEFRTRCADMVVDAYEILGRDWPAVCDVAAALISSHALTGDDAHAIVKASGEYSRKILRRA